MKKCNLARQDKNQETRWWALSAKSTDRTLPKTIDLIPSSILFAEIPINR
jgi:hypothetical protein